MNKIALNTINIFAVIIGVISIGIIIHEKQENLNHEHTNSKKKDAVYNHCTDIHYMHDCKQINQTKL